LLFNFKTLPSNWVTGWKPQNSTSHVSSKSISPRENHVNSNVPTTIENAVGNGIPTNSVDSERTISDLDINQTTSTKNSINQVNQTEITTTKTNNTTTHTIPPDVVNEFQSHTQTRRGTKDKYIPNRYDICQVNLPKALVAFV